MLISSMNHDVNFQRAIASCKVFEHFLHFLDIQQEVVHGTISRSFRRNHNTTYAISYSTYWLQLYAMRQ